MNPASKSRTKLTSPQQPARIPNSSRKAFSFGVYSKIFPDHMNVPLWAMLVVPGIVFVIIYFSEDEPQAWALVAAIACVGIFLVRWAIEYIRKLATYNAYKDFPATLGFELQGWELVGAFTNQLKYRHWSNETVVQVFVFEHATQPELKKVKAALDAFITKSGKHFYHSDAKTDWQYHGSLRIRGSSDANVIGDIYTLISVQLRGIQEKSKIIRAVSVQFDPKVFKIEPPKDTDTMS